LRTDPGGFAVTLEYVVGIVLTALLSAYLIYALIHPERF
jgi:K+-transporting ATPase KdpF subunit